MGGQFAGRREDRRLVTGAGRYTDDWFLPGQIHGHFVRSDRAHAEILGMDLDAARAMPGVIAILTAGDMKRAGIALPLPNPAPAAKSDSPIRTPVRDVLADRRVLHVGQPVALVVAEDATAAQDAAEAVLVDYRELPCVIDPEFALSGEAPELHAEVPGNLCFEYEYGDAAAAEAAFASAAHVARVKLVSQRLAGNPMEPKACIASFDAGTGSFDIYCPTQGLSMTRVLFARGLRIPEERIRLHAPDVGGAFGVRIEAYPEYLALALAAKTLGRPVKWVSSRSETILSDFHGRALKLMGELALAEDGTFLAARYTWIVDAGAYPSTSGAVVNTIGPSSYMVGLYRTPVIHGLHRVALTNTVPTTPYRGSARPSVSYLVERLVDEAAHTIGIDPVELRRRNLLPKEAFPYRTPVGSVYDSGDPPGLLETAVRAADLGGFPARRAQSEARGRLRGLGVSLFVESAGGGRSPREEAAIRFGADGGILIHTMSGASGQGHETVFPEVVGSILGIPAEEITLRASDPAGPPLQGDGSVGSRSVMAHGGALSVAVDEVVRKGRALAADHLEVSAADLDFVGGRYLVAGTDLSIGLRDLVRLHAGAGEHPLDTVGHVVSPQSFPSGAHVAEVEIDPETGEAEVVAYVAVDDCGRVINPVLVEGQLQGGVMQAFGQVFGEHCLYDEATGQLLTGSFMDYYMPRATAAHPFVAIDHSVPSPNNPLGAKGVGEAGTTGALPALANAVIDALRPFGIDHLDMPYTPFRLWSAIRDAKRAGKPIRPGRTETP